MAYVEVSRYAGRKICRWGEGEGEGSGWGFAKYSTAVKKIQIQVFTKLVKSKKIFFVDYSYVFVNIQTNIHLINFYCTTEEVTEIYIRFF